MCSEAGFSKGTRVTPRGSSWISWELKAQGGVGLVGGRLRRDLGGCSSLGGSPPACLHGPGTGAASLPGAAPRPAGGESPRGVAGLRYCIPVTRQSLSGLCSHSLDMKKMPIFLHFFQRLFDFIFSTPSFNCFVVSTSERPGEGHLDCATSLPSWVCLL